MTDQQGARSESTPPPSRRPMQLVGERQVPDPQPLSDLIAGATTTATAPPKPTGPWIKDGVPPVSRETEYVHRAAWKAGVLGALNVVVAVIAVRFILLVAVAGAVAATFLAMQAPDLFRCVAAAIYAITVVCPLIWLSSRR